MSRRQEEYAAKKNGYSPQNSSPSRDAEKDADDVRRVPTGDAAVFYSDATAAGEAGSVSRGYAPGHCNLCVGYLTSSGSNPATFNSLPLGERLEQAFSSV